MFVFVTLPSGLDAEALLPLCMARGLVYVPGRPFHPGGGGEATLRLNFVSSKLGAKSPRAIFSPRVAMIPPTWNFENTASASESGG